MSGFRSLNNSTSKEVLNLLEPVKLTVWKVMIESVTVVKFRVNYGGGNGAGCFEVKVRADTAKFTNECSTVGGDNRSCGDTVIIKYSTTRTILPWRGVRTAYIAPPPLATGLYHIVEQGYIYIVLFQV